LAPGLKTLHGIGPRGFPCATGRYNQTPTLREALKYPRGKPSQSA